MTSYKAIPTNYKGVNFRSRTEARWAAFFDEIGWTWRYEHDYFGDEGETDATVRYSVDFRVNPSDNLEDYFYVEVKKSPYFDDEIKQAAEKCLKSGMPSGSRILFVGSGINLGTIPKLYKKYQQYCIFCCLKKGKICWEEDWEEDWEGIRQYSQITYSPLSEKLHLGWMGNIYSDKDTKNIKIDDVFYFKNEKLEANLYQTVNSFVPIGSTEQVFFLQKDYSLSQNNFYFAEANIIESCRELRNKWIEAQNTVQWNPAPPCPPVPNFPVSSFLPQGFSKPD